MERNFQIAIDGPVAAGKSSVAKKLAERLGFVYVDTGAIYRAVTLAALRRGVGVGDEYLLVQLANGLKIDVRLPGKNEEDGRQSTVLMNGEDVSWEIRSGKVNRDVAHVSQWLRLRNVLVSMQRRIARDQNVVMEGRDITYAVLPDADLKIFLDASDEVRIERYYRKLEGKKKSLTKEKVGEWLKERDEMDSERAISPLRLGEGVWHLDTSGLSIDEVVDLIIKRVGELRAKH